MDLDLEPLNEAIKKLEKAYLPSIIYGVTSICCFWLKAFAMPSRGRR